MKIVGLISGGKDSIYNLIECIRNGHEVVALAHLSPPKSDHEEMDSYMYQTVGHNVIEMIAQAMELPLTQGTISGKPNSQEEIYRINRDDEVEDLFRLLSDVKAKHPEVTGVASGAILSTYQRIRVENVCSRLGLTSFCYLWKRDQDELLQEMIKSKMNAIIIKVASMGLEPSKHLLKTIEQLYPTLKKLNQQYGVNICGEGGEYESLVLDCPIFKKRIQLDETKVKIHSDDAFSQVAFVSIIKSSLVDKSAEELAECAKEQLQPYDAWRSLATWSDHFSFDTTPVSALEPFKPNIHQLSQSSTSSSSPAGLLAAYGSLELRESSRGYFTVRSHSGCSTTSAASSNAGEVLSSILDNLNKLLSDNSLSLEHLLFVNLYLADINDFGAINQAYFKHFKDNPAARACVQVGLQHPGQRVMLDVVGNRQTKKSLHVQSISNWAPACIGPYSQATHCNQTLFLAGQVGLEPSSLQLVPKGVECELQQIIINLASVLQALGDNSLKSTLQVVALLKEIKWSNLVQFYLENVFRDNRVKPLLLVAEVGAMPKGANVELLLLNETTEQVSEFGHFATEKNFHDAVKGLSTGYSHIVSNPGQTSLMNFHLSIDVDDSSTISASQVAAYFAASLKDVLLAEVSAPLINHIQSSIVYIKIYYIRTISTLDTELFNKLSEALEGVSISFVPVNHLFINGGSPNIVINSEVFISRLSTSSLS
ncbi:hypothetical protein SAMD00019534_117980 [Acytostelium subglobosum LB1]|uniref:hypothetical protein n=1 Tax=Acytostelium subglobosum LB1 TaxID=1410327 RepID=UPI000644B1DD|nr:hypothetical protein SAMD00019534_117980 [Acytostelium subglobosum LB1]GAM28622.1 hypothetical protein SAMD00019534_117980 [Acytostelium subglobosum LB1]|eukprot:XP_012748400.1 hypothetical protein SAMD00019534_117980 [Acytostelium subglobosum LB1]